VTQPIIHQRNGYEKAVAELRRIADLLEGLPPGFAPSHVGIDIHAGKPDSASAIAAVDAVGMALLGKAGTTDQMHDDTYHHRLGNDWSDPVKISVYQTVPAPAPVHYLEYGVDGDDDDRMACGQRFGDAVKKGQFSGDPDQVTCPACLPTAALYVSGGQL
jgi:hypothetical protein